MKRKKVSRRNFLRSALAGTAGAAAAGAASGAEPQVQEPAARKPKTPPKYSDYLASKVEQVLPPTDNNIEGPFYRPGAPFRLDGRLSEPTDKGDHLVITGKIVGTDGKPIPGAVLDVWHCSSFGRYDNDDPDTPPPEDVFRFRGRIKADREGNYRIATVRPGHYKLTPTEYRTAHMHWKCTADGFVPLTSQFFFKGEQYNKTDSWFKPAMVLDLQPDGDRLVTSFTIVLAKA
jgi:protocatechuate 3,4-dioxygenase beta subunit